MDYSLLLQNQRDFFNTGVTKNINFRKKSLLNLKKILKENEAELNKAIFLDFKKSEYDNYLTELSIIYDEINYFLKNLDKLAKPQKVKSNLTTFPSKNKIIPEPLGCCLIIGAWNYPYQLTLAPLVSAIAAGNTCIIKPSELPVNTMHMIEKLINSNFSENYLKVITGAVEETTALLNLQYDKIFFTGSPKVGQIVYEAAAKHLTPVTLELGGKSPVIVSNKADINKAAKRISWAKYLNAGQTCVAPDYALVHIDVVDKFLTSLKLVIKDSEYTDGSIQYVSIINERNFDRLQNLLSANNIIYGGNYNASTRYIEPTVIYPCHWDDNIMKEEIFGPILPIITYENLEEILDIIKKKEKPLSAYIFTENKEEKKLFENTISFGGGCINDCIMHLANGNLPFGGVGQSGIGNYHHQFGFYTFSHQKAILEKRGTFEPKLKYPPYNMNLLKWIKKFL